jgi:hypothetical protein
MAHKYKIDPPQRNVVNEPIVAYVTQSSYSSFYNLLSLKKIGDDFLKKNEYLLLRILSSIVPMEHNYLLNVQHPDMQKVKSRNKVPFYFDKGLYNN